MAFSQPLLVLNDLNVVAPSITQDTLDDLLALVEVWAPCLSTAEASEGSRRAAKAILRQALARKHDREKDGRGEVTTYSDTTGPFNRQRTVDTRSSTDRSRGVLYESEVRQLRDLCAAATSVGPRGDFPPATDHNRILGL